jgi:hypothetical protein
MTSIQSRSASNNGANDSRPGELRSGVGPWRQSLSRAHRAIDISVRRIDSSIDVIGAAQRYAFGPLSETNQRLERLTLTVLDVGENLRRAALGLKETNDRMAEAPELAGGAPEQCIEATALWIETAQRLAVLSECVDTLFKLYITGPRTSQFSLPADGYRPPIPVRRQRFKPVLTVAEAPRRVSRGRAPPLLSTCQL